MQKVTSRNKRFTKIEINLSNFASNIRILRSNIDSRNTKIMGVVKSNAYGHGVLEISKQAVKSGVWALGVVLAEDGIKIRKAGLKCPIIILGEPPLEIIRDALKYDFTLCLNSLEKAQAISDKCASFGKKMKVHLKVDTGMNRVGINFRDAVEEIERIASLQSITVGGIFTHFACAGEKDQSYTEMQWKRFQGVLDALGEKKLRFKTVHCANSAAFLQDKKYHLDMVRLGISMYGLRPFDMDADKWLSRDTLSIINNLKPVLTLKSKVSFVKKLSAGEYISYGATFKTSRDSTIATIPIGYADGYTRLYSNKASVLINGGLAPVVGNVTMDQVMVDVTDVPGCDNISEGTEVTLIGNSNKKEISADYLSRLIGTINYEVLCMLKDRIPRSYIY
jgi:alanine racemase